MTEVFRGAAGHDLFFGDALVTWPDGALTGSTASVKVRRGVATDLVEIEQGVSADGIVEWDGETLSVQLKPAGTTKAVGHSRAELTVNTVNGMKLHALLCLLDIQA